MKSGSQEGTGLGMGRMGLAKGGFTMIEIVVVIAIIAILTSLGLMVGNKVRLNSQVTATRQMIMSLDSALTSVESDKGSKVSGIWRDEAGNEYGVIDGWDQSGIIEPSQGLLLLATGQHAALKDMILRADSKYVSNTTLQTSQAPGGAPIVKIPVLKDAWGNPIRFVHPRFDGGYGDYLDLTGNPVTRANMMFKAKLANNSIQTREFVRSYRTAGGKGSADEGLCTGGRGYFYSIGPDGEPGTRDDNVYLDAPPKFPSETANLH